MYERVEIDKVIKAGLPRAEYQSELTGFPGRQGGRVVEPAQPARR